ncbi:MAG: DUF4830 domain-containing protein [Ruminococcus sp.]|nr:DUF4830 domain-containing protein [Ruminococcus sp.]
MKKKKIFRISALIMSLIFIAVLCVKNSGSPDICLTMENVSAYLLTHGWETDTEKITSQSITIPSEFNEIYQSYNEVQKQQGFDLKKHRGSSATLLTCPVTNYGTDENVVCELILKDTQLIGANLSLTGKNGFIKPLDTH